MIGYFGKIPSHGDFVSKGLPPALVAAWDAWLQGCMLESQRQLGDRWLPLYLNSPVWRFAISPGLLGPEGLGGVMMPSVDRVGRYFPLMIAVTGSSLLPAGVRQQTVWYDDIEELARASLAPGFKLDLFDMTPAPSEMSFASSSIIGSTQRFPGDEEGCNLWWVDGPSDVVACRSFPAMPGSHAFVEMLKTHDG